LLAQGREPENHELAIAVMALHRSQQQTSKQNPFPGTDFPQVHLLRPAVRTLHWPVLSQPGLRRVAPHLRRSAGRVEKPLPRVKASRRRPRSDAQYDAQYTVQVPGRYALVRRKIAPCRGASNARGLRSPVLVRRTKQVPAPQQKTVCGILSLSCLLILPGLAVSSLLPTASFLRYADCPIAIDLAGGTLVVFRPRRPGLCLRRPSGAGGSNAICSDWPHRDLSAGDG